MYYCDKVYPLLYLSKSRSMAYFAVGKDTNLVLSSLFQIFAWTNSLGFSVFSLSHRSSKLSFVKTMHTMRTSFLSLFSTSTELTIGKKIPYFCEKEEFNFLLKLHYRSNKIQHFQSNYYALDFHSYWLHGNSLTRLYFLFVQHWYQQSF